MYLVVIDAALSIGATPLVSARVSAVLGAASSVQGTILVALALVWGEGSNCNFKIKKQKFLAEFKADLGKLPLNRN